MSSDNSILVFSAEDVRKSLSMSNAISAMKEVFSEVSAGKSSIPQRTHVRIPKHNGDSLFMPSYSPAIDRIGLKVVNLHPGNRELGLPFIQAMVMVMDAVTGTPLAVLNGAALTAIRTGAASGAATDMLALPDATNVAIFGSGAQAVTQLEAVCTVRDITSVRVFDISRESAEDFSVRMSEYLCVDVKPAASAAEALEFAEIVCTATTAKTPVFADSDLRAGTHINAIGSYKPNVREIPPETVARACVVVDQIDAAWEEAGDLIMARDEGMITEHHIHAELGQIINGTETGRAAMDQITFFKSVGVATQDLAAAHLVVENGSALGLGVSVPF